MYVLAKYIKYDPVKKLYYFHDHNLFLNCSFTFFFIEVQVNLVISKFTGPLQNFELSEIRLDKYVDILCGANQCVSVITCIVYSQNQEIGKLNYLKVFGSM